MFLSYSKTIVIRRTMNQYYPNRPFDCKNTKPCDTPFLFLTHGTVPCCCYKWYFISVILKQNGIIYSYLT
ncbi:hypothetical protein CW304_29325 [Bacillus sp. UFRGS-B20]|nr:hypothetical protein CW304_29325 [Bacillus sp. UFRGS-B20]